MPEGYWRSFGFAQDDRPFLEGPSASLRTTGFFGRSFGFAQDDRLFFGGPSASLRMTGFFGRSFGFAQDDRLFWEVVAPPSSVPALSRCARLFDSAQDDGLCFPKSRPRPYQAAAALGTRGSLAAVKVPSRQPTALLAPMVGCTSSPWPRSARCLSTDSDMRVSMRIWSGRHW